VNIVIGIFSAVATFLIAWDVFIPFAKVAGRYEAMRVSDPYQAWDQRRTNRLITGTMIAFLTVAVELAQGLAWRIAPYVG